MNRASKSPTEGVTQGKMSQRQQRVAEEIKQALSNIFLRGDFTDASLHTWFQNNAVTITHVSVSPDLKNAKIYLVILGDFVKSDPNQSQGIASLLKLLKEANKELRYELGKAVGLRYVPTLRFLPDESFEQTQRLEALFIKHQITSTEEDPQ